MMPNLCWMGHCCCQPGGTCWVRTVCRINCCTRCIPALGFAVGMAPGKEGFMMKKVGRKKGSGYRWGVGGEVD
jgi:hypothetical protein